jgi:myosin heavy subunit
MSQVNQKEAAKPMHLEDLAALKEVSEDTVLDELQNRHLDGLSYTFVGDVLLYVNPNRDEPLYEKKVTSLSRTIAENYFLLLYDFKH